MAKSRVVHDDKWRGALIASGAIHVGIIAFLFLAMLNCERFNSALTAMGIPEWGHLECRKPLVMPGPIIEASLVGPTAAPKAGNRGKQPPKPAAPEPPKPEPPKPEPPKPEVVPPVAPQPEPPKPEPTPPKPDPKPEPVKPEPTPEAPPPPIKEDTVERDRVAALAAEQAKEKKEQEATKKREQELLEEKKQEAEQAKIEKQLADIRKEREAAEKQLNKEKAKAEQLADLAKAAQREAAQPAAAAKPERIAGEPGPVAEQEAKQAMSGRNGTDNGLEARYYAAMQGAVTQNWNRPDNAPPGVRCKVLIVQIPGGEVISAQVTSPCNADQATRTSIEQAVMKASPLPYQGYEPVFIRSFNFNFQYDG